MNSERGAAAAATEGSLVVLEVGATKCARLVRLLERILERRPELRRDPLVIAELNTSNIFTGDKYEVR